MPRELHADVITALGQSHINFIVLCTFAVGPTVLRLCTRLSSITIGGNEYTGSGTIGGVDVFAENNKLDPSGAEIRLSGVDLSLVATFSNHEFLNRRATVSYGVLTDSDVLIGDPILVFSGSIDSVDVVYGLEPEINIGVSDALADWDRAQAEFWSDSEQQRLYPGDKGFSMVEGLSKKTIIWPGVDWRP